MKKLVIGLLAVVLLLVPVACARETAPTPVPPAPGPAPAPGSEPSLPMTPPRAHYSAGVKVVPSQTAYMPGEEVELELILNNDSIEPVYVCSLPPSLSILMPGPEPEFDKVVYTFPAGTEEVKLGVGETVTYGKITWNQKDEAGKQVPPGWYYYNIEYTVRKESPPPMDWGAGSQSRAFLIQYPQGAMEKIIDLNQTQTATGLPFDVDGEVRSADIVFTVKRVELNQERASFFVLVTSPNNPLPDYDNHNWRSMRMEARYVIDGVIKDARPHNRKFTDDGIEIRCGYNGSYLDPVPSDAKELTFIITRFGDWEGPWEFKVPLE